MSGIKDFLSDRKKNIIALVLAIIIVVSSPLAALASLQTDSRVVAVVNTHTATLAGIDKTIHILKEDLAQNTKATKTVDGIFTKAGQVSSQLETQMAALQTQSNAIETELNTLEAQVTLLQESKQ